MLLKQVFKNTIAQSVGRIGSIVISLLLTRILYQEFGNEGFGAYAFISSFVLLFGQISDWGTNLITVREGAKDEKRQPEIFGSTLFLRLALSVVGLVLVNIVIRTHAGWENLVGPTTVASFLLIFLSLKTSAAAIFQTLKRLDLAALFDFLSSLLFLALTIFVIKNYGANLESLMFAWFLATLVVGLASVLVAVRFTKINWKVNLEIAKKVLLESSPTGALLVTFTLYNRIDIVVLQYFQGNAEVAPYALSYKVYDNVVLGAAFLMNSLFPLLSAEFAKHPPSSEAGSPSLKNYYQKAFDLLIICALALFVFLQAFAGPIVNLLSDGPNPQAEFVLRVLSLAMLFAYFNHLTGFSLIAAGRQKISLIIAIIALVFNVAANFLFVPLYSFRASSWLTVATEGLVLLISTLVIWKTLRIVPQPFNFPKTLLELVKK